jgi:hypothetical protein
VYPSSVLSARDHPAQDAVVENGLKSAAAHISRRFMRHFFCSRRFFFTDEYE